jgi:dienelactone hydrolase
MDMMAILDGPEPVRGVAGGVPYVALPPAQHRDTASLVVAWHMADPPRSEAAMAAALPLAGVPAWRVYLGLPLFGARESGWQRLMEEDFVAGFVAQVAGQAAAEVPAAVAALRSELGIAGGPIGLVGGSVGSAAALLVLAEGVLPVKAVALISPVTQAAPVVAVVERDLGIAHRWTDEARSAARRFDFLSRAAEIARRDPQPPVLLVAGERDEAEFREPAAAFQDRLSHLYADPRRVRLVIVPGMGHAIAKDPGTEAAPQTTDAATVDALLTEWFLRHLGG